MITKEQKKEKVIFWLATGLLALFILPGIFFINSPAALEGSAHIQVPEWLRLEVGIGHFIGALILILPWLGNRIKEWAYVALGIEYLSAFIAHVYVDGLTGNAFFALIIFAVLLVSYLYHHKLHPGIFKNT